jgi:putative transposase
VGNLAKDLEDVGRRARFLIRDRERQDGVRMPRMNAIMERWIQTCRRELLRAVPASSPPAGKP